MKPIPSRSWDDLAHRALRLADAAPGRLRSRLARRRRSGRQRPAEDRGHEVQRGDDDDQRRGAGDLHDERPEEGNPTANAAFRVSVKIPFADISCSLGTSFGIIAASAGPKKTVIVETVMFSR